MTKFLSEMIRSAKDRSAAFIFGIQKGKEAARAAEYWAGLGNFEDYDNDELGMIRSRWVADVALPMVQASSVLEVGTNSGRNLRTIRASDPGIRLKGIDVNEKAIEYARRVTPDIDFAIGDANSWNEPVDAWDAVLTMSLLDHIPEGAARVLARNIAQSSRSVIAIELWDGSSGTRGRYKYSRNTALMFAECGYQTLLWEKSVGQYDEKRSLLWSYVGHRPETR